MTSKLTNIVKKIKKLSPIQKVKYWLLTGVMLLALDMMVYIVHPKLELNYLSEGSFEYWGSFLFYNIIQVLLGPLALILFNIPHIFVSLY